MSRLPDASAPADWSVAKLAAQSLACLDLTSLGEDDDALRISALCTAADTPFGAPAAICVYPEWISLARERLERSGLGDVRVATVVNFPDGGADPGRAVRECRRASAAGAQEIDLVFPWRALRAGDANTGQRLVAECRSALGAERCLKVILETGELGQPALIREASRIALAAGADFIKTSTGKTPVSATPGAAATMLGAIAEHGRGGFKASGGVRCVADARPYFDLAERQLGAGWACPANFRIGASSLLGDICAVLREDADHVLAR